MDAFTLSSLSLPGEVGPTAHETCRPGLFDTEAHPLEHPDGPQPITCSDSRRPIAPRHRAGVAVLHPARRGLPGLKPRVPRQTARVVRRGGSGPNDGRRGGPWAHPSRRCGRLDQGSYRRTNAGPPAAEASSRNRPRCPASRERDSWPPAPRSPPIFWRREVFSPPKKA